MPHTFFKSNNAWNRFCSWIHCCEICPKCLFDFDKLKQCVCSTRTACNIILEKRETENKWLQIITKSKHTRWPFRPKVFLISQMWSTLPGVSFSSCVCWNASFPQAVYDSEDEVLNRFLLHTLSLRCLDDSETLLGSGTELKAHRWTMKLPSSPSKLPVYPWENTLARTLVSNARFQ